ncbi:methylmalonyl Co-A mutase-associated GTPase MeaB [bacterium]|nr:methylmalonyl Co-A mutase-associated GTPase MeaB [bacterium]
MCAAINNDALADPVSLGRLLTRLEDDPGAAREILAQLPAPPPGTHRIGITGSPGVGKSTLMGRLIQRYRRNDFPVGVVAVDPTSPLTGGAILGDRIRLGDVQADPGVFIRSLGSRGSLGGVTPGASAVAGTLEAAGYRRILIETVGVGQTGYDVICLADTVIALFSPEAGDGVQLLKAGILEIGDIFVVNKSDRPGAELMFKEISQSLEISQLTAADRLHHGPAASEEQVPDAPVDCWHPPVLAVSARDDEGVAEVLAAAESHRDWLAGLPADHPRRRRRIARELGFVLRSRVSRALELELAGRVEQLAARVYQEELALWEAVDELRRDLRELL